MGNVNLSRTTDHFLPYCKLILDLFIATVRTWTHRPFLLVLCSPKSPNYSSRENLYSRTCLSANAIPGFMHVDQVFPKYSKRTYTFFLVQCGLHYMTCKSKTSKRVLIVGCTYMLLQHSLIRTHWSLQGLSKKSSPLCAPLVIQKKWYGQLSRSQRNQSILKFPLELQRQKIRQKISIQKK